MLRNILGVCLGISLVGMCTAMEGENPVFYKSVSDLRPAPADSLGKPPLHDGRSRARRSSSCPTKGLSRSKSWSSMPQMVKEAVSKASKRQTEWRRPSQEMSWVQAAPGSRRFSKNSWEDPAEGEVFKLLALSNARRSTGEPVRRATADSLESASMDQAASSSTEREVSTPTSTES